MSTTDDLRAIRDSISDGSPLPPEGAVGGLRKALLATLSVLIAERSSKPGDDLAVAGSTDESDEPVTLYITFGVRYLHEVHPSGLPVHPDGWWEIRGMSYLQGRAVVHALTQGKFSTDYLEEPDLHLFPRGCLYVVEARVPGSSR